MRLLTDLKICSVLVILNLFTMDGVIVWTTLLLYTIVVGMNLFYNIQKSGVLQDTKYLEKLNFIIPILSVAFIALGLSFIAGYLVLCR